jgi:predicted dehydrogenase
MSKPEGVSRRSFLTRTAKAGAVGAAVPMFVESGVLGAPGKPGANERIHVGLIGAGGMGSANVSECAKYPDVSVTAICDVWKRKRESLAARFKGSAKTYSDYRDVLRQKDVDAVIIATPHHWHCRMAVDACEAGKDLYESRVVKNAVLKHKRVCQVGTQVHASETYRRVVEWVQSGRLGKISVARTFLVSNEGNPPDGLGFPPDSAPPDGLDWDLWVGPGPMRAFNPNIVKNGWSHTLFLDYGGGRTCGMASHILDLPFWALNLGFPLRVHSVSSKHCVHDNTDAPDTHEVIWEFPDVVLTWSMSQVSSFGFNLQEAQRYTKYGAGMKGVERRLGYYLHGAKGTIYGNYATHTVVPQCAELADAKPPKATIPPSPGHEREWLDCIGSRQEPSCGVTYAHKVSTANMLANLAMKVGRPLRFDPATESIVADAEAPRRARPEYRAPWKFPAEYLNT